MYYIFKTLNNIIFYAVIVMSEHVRKCSCGPQPLPVVPSSHVPQVFPENIEMY